jgi:hypothetical protein
MKEFAIVPIETVLACKCISKTVLDAIGDNIPVSKEEPREIYFASSPIAEQLITIGGEEWPLIVEQKSPSHNKLIMLVESATEWLENPDFPLLFEEHRKFLLTCLKPLRSFSASGLATQSDGLVINRSSVLLRQSIAVRSYLKHNLYLRIPQNPRHEHEMARYNSFLMTLKWMRKDPLKRMFAPEFNGTYVEHAAEVQDDPTSDYVSLAGKSTCYHSPSLSNAGLDTVSVTNIHTPSTTRPTSPALTERPNGTANGNDCDKRPTKPPTLKYIAIIETDTDKAFYNFDSSDINQKKHVVLVRAKEMHTEMMAKGYEGNIKLQDIMDIAVKMGME